MVHPGAVIRSEQVFVLTGGERTQVNMALLAQAGFVPTQVIPTSSPYTRTCMAQNAMAECRGHDGYDHHPAETLAPIRLGPTAQMPHLSLAGRPLSYPRRR
jgi:hypothetical protein